MQILQIMLQWFYSYGNMIKYKYSINFSLLSIIVARRGMWRVIILKSFISECIE